MGLLPAPGRSSPPFWPWPANAAPSPPPGFDVRLQAGAAANTITGGKVAILFDLSGNGHHAYQPDVALYLPPVPGAIGGKTALLFPAPNPGVRQAFYTNDGTPGFPALTDPAPYTIVTYFKPTAARGGFVWRRGGANVAGTASVVCYEVNGGVTLFLFTNETNAALDTTATPTLDQTGVVTMLIYSVLADGSSRAWINHTSMVLAGPALPAAPASGYLLGNRYPLTGISDIPMNALWAESIHYPFAFDAGLAAGGLAYGQAVYGIT